MTSFLTVFIFFVVTLYGNCLAASNVTDNETCAKSVEIMDKIFKESLFIKQGSKFPVTSDEIDAYCKNGKLFSAEVKNFNECSSPFPRQVIQIMGKSLSKTMKSMCKNRPALASALSCVTPAYHQSLQSCGLVLVNQIYILSSNLTSEQLFPLICCSFHRLTDCIRSAEMPTCSDPKLNITEYIMIQVDRLIKDFIDLLCGRWPTSKECQITAPEVAEMLSKVSNVRGFRSDESLLGTILQIVTKLSDE